MTRLRRLSPVAQFALSGLVVLALLGFGAVQLLAHTASNEAIRDARDVTRLAGEGVVSTALTPAFFRRDPAALARVDRIVRRAVLSKSIVRVKIWDATGRILYSDEPRIIGSRYSPGADEQHALRSGQAEAEVSDLTKPENRFERQYHKLLEVYLGVRTPAGPRVLFETYQRYSSVAASGRRLWQTFLPALILALVLLYVVQIPLAGSLVRRLRRGQHEREELLRRAVEASELERRRIARDLHDGAVQTLAGVSYRLSAVSEPLRGDDRPEAAAVAEAGTDVRRSIRELRTLLVDLYPPTLHQAGLGAAVSDLLAPLADQSIGTELDVDPDLRLTPEAEALLFRAAQEALRNVAKHADAEHVAVHVGRRNGHGLLEVRDDGRGFAPGAPADPATNGSARPGHFGLRMIQDLARDAGGTVIVDSQPGKGTTVRVSVPA